MIRAHLNRALLIAAASLVTTSGYADEKKADKAAEKQEKRDEKKAEKADKKDEKADDKDEKKARHADGDADHERHHKAWKEKVRARLKGHVADEAVKQELRRHAERVARLQRIKQLATDAKDNDTVEKAKKLLEKEDARHEKWMDKHVPATPAATGTAPAVPLEKKEGAK